MNKKIIIPVVIVSFIIGMISLFMYIADAKKEWCLNNPKECSRRAAESNRYLEEQRKKESELSCGPTMPGMDPGWGGWKCSYDD